MTFSNRSTADTNSQPAPKPNDNPAVWALVIKDMADRDAFGYAKYGTRLQPGNGRDFLIDAYQEALDLVVYLRGAIYERDSMLAPIEPASLMQDDSPRMQAIGQNGNDGGHYLGLGQDSNKLDNQSSSE